MAKFIEVTVLPVRPIDTEYTAFINVDTLCKIRPFDSGSKIYYNFYDELDAQIAYDLVKESPSQIRDLIAR